MGKVSDISMLLCKIVDFKLLFFNRGSNKERFNGWIKVIVNVISYLFICCVI